MNTFWMDKITFYEHMGSNVYFLRGSKETKRGNLPPAINRLPALPPGEIKKIEKCSRFLSVQKRYAYDEKRQETILNYVQNFASVGTKIVIVCKFIDEAKQLYFKYVERKGDNACVCVLTRDGKNKKEIDLISFDRGTAGVMFTTEFFLEKFFNERSKDTTRSYAFYVIDVRLTNVKHFNNLRRNLLLLEQDRLYKVLDNFPCNKNYFGSGYEPPKNLSLPFV